MELVGGIHTRQLTSLNGLLDVQGHWVTPLNWRAGIHGLRAVALTPGMNGLSDLMEFEGSGGSDPLVRNPIHPGLGDLMEFPGSGGSDVLVRNPIHPDSPSSGLRFVGGQRNRIADTTCARKAPSKGGDTGMATDTSGVSASDELLGLTETHNILAVFGLAGLGCDGVCGCGGGCGMGATSPSSSSTGTNTTNAIDWSLSGNALGSFSPSLSTIPNWALYAGGAALLLLLSKGGK